MRSARSSPSAHWSRWRHRFTAAGAADRPNTLILVCAVVALVLTAINMFGGFAVTRRMLDMFRK